MVTNLFRISLLSLMICCVSSAFAQNDSLLGMINHELIKIHRTNGGYKKHLSIKNIPSGHNPVRIVFSKSSDCYYTLSDHNTASHLGRITMNGNYKEIAKVSMNTGKIYRAESLAIDRRTDKVYISGSLDAWDAYSETLLEIDTSTAVCTKIKALKTQHNGKDADAMAFDTGGRLYFLDAVPPGPNKAYIYFVDLKGTAQATLVYSSTYFPCPDFTVHSNAIYFVSVRDYYEFNLTTKIKKKVKALHSSSNFNGNKALGITWIDRCKKYNPAKKDSICETDSIYLKASTMGSSYKWQNKTTSNSITVNKAGTYWVDIEKDGCTIRDSFLVSAIPLVKFDLGRDTTLCYNTSIDFKIGISGATYLWDDKNTTSIRNLDKSGLYWLEITKDGCSNRDSIVVKTTPEINIDIGRDTIICANTGIEFTIKSNGQYFSWDDLSISKTRVVNKSGSYWVKAGIESCFKSDTIKVKVLSPILLDLGPDTTICIGDSLNLSITNSNADSYLWDNKDKTDTRTLKTTGIYWAETTVGKCLKRDSISLVVANNEVHYPIRDTIICDKDSIKVQLAFLAPVLWNDLDTSKTRFIKKGGFYFFKTTEGCSLRDTFNLRITKAFVDLGKDSVFCDSVTALLETTDTFYSYLWNDNSNKSKMYVKNPGIKWVEVTNSFGCAAQDTVAFSISKSPTVDLGKDTTLCVSYSAILDGGLAHSYLWKNSTKNQYLLVSKPGLYWVEASNSDGCKDRDSIQVSYIAPPNLAPLRDTLLCDNQTLLISMQMDSGFRYFWNNRDTGNNYLVKKEGEITLEVTGKNNCKSYDTVFISMEHCEKLFIPNVFTPGEDGYNDNFYIEHIGYDVVDGTIVNRWGQVVYKFSLPKDDFWNGKVNNTNAECPDGTYYYSLIFKNISLQKEFTMNGIITLIREK